MIWSTFFKTNESVIFQIFSMFQNWRERGSVARRESQPDNWAEFWPRQKYKYRIHQNLLHPKETRNIIWKNVTSDWMLTWIRYRFRVIRNSRLKKEEDPDSFRKSEILVNLVLQIISTKFLVRTSFEFRKFY